MSAVPGPADNSPATLREPYLLHLPSSPTRLRLLGSFPCESIVRSRGTAPWLGSVRARHGCSGRSRAFTEACGGETGSEGGGGSGPRAEDDRAVAEDPEEPTTTTGDDDDDDDKRTKWGFADRRRRVHAFPPSILCAGQTTFPKRCFSRMVEERYSIVGGSFSSSPRFPDGALGVMGDERVEIGGIVSNISHSCIKKEERKEGIILILGSVFHRECTAIS